MNASPIATITPGQLDKTLLARVAAGPVALAIAESARAGIEASVAAVRTLVSRHEPVYGINTGFGKLAQTRIADDQLTQLQKNLLLAVGRSWVGSRPSRCGEMMEPIGPG